MAVLAVIPSDPLADYEDVGCHVWAQRYYNPNKYFEKVFLFSPKEKEEVFQYGMQTIPTRPRELRRRVRKHGVDIVRAYGGYWACDMAAKNKVRGVPVVVSVHDTNPEELYDSIRRADYVFCMSDVVRDLVLSRFPDPDKVWVLPNRYDESVMRPLANEDFSDLDEACPFRYRLICVGRLSEGKNQDTVVRALAHLGPDYGCLFIGRNDPGSLQTLADDLGVRAQCRFIKAVRNDLLPRYYNWAHAVVTPSRWEGFGIVFIEALACGAVVVTSNVRPMREYIAHEENGLLVDEYENPKALAETIERACNDEALRRRLKERAPGSVECFERGRVDALEVNYYRRILAERPFYANRRRHYERCFRRALKWIRRNTAPGEGILRSSLHRRPYPEVSGYFIPTLLALGDRKRAIQFARWLVGVQNEDGSWNGPRADEDPYTFDVGQVLKGLLAIHNILPEVQPALLRGCEWLVSRVAPDGSISTPSTGALELPDGSVVPEAFHLYALEPLAAVAEEFSRGDWAEAVARALAYYKQDPRLTDFGALSHFHAYILEALVDLGEAELASKAMDAVEALQREDGSVPAYANADWVCSTGVAQYALIWLKLDRPEPARRAFAWLCANQNRSGGFYGSCGEEANYYENAEISWAVKYFLDAHLRLAGAGDKGESRRSAAPCWRLR